MNGSPDKIFCSKCHKHLDISELKPFDEFLCPVCGTRLKVPFIFERYYLMDLCGIGGMSKVYRAIDPVLGINVAIKITDENAYESASVGERFTHEAELVAKINHPGIVRVYRGGIFMNQPYLVMEFMKKGTLEVLQKTFMLPPVEKILFWMAIIADGLYAASKLGIVHHDVKPANIMLSEEGDVKIGDFDLAEINTDKDAAETSGWASLAYVSPERILTGKEDYRGDIFSLGASTYELLTGEYPFGNSGTADELLDLRRKCSFEPAHLLNSTVPPAISDFLYEMMAFKPSARPSYNEVINMFKSAGKIRHREHSSKTIFSFFAKNHERNS